MAYDGGHHGGGSGGGCGGGLAGVDAGSGGFGAALYSLSGFLALLADFH